jgi:predicted peptidase
MKVSLRLLLPAIALLLGSGCMHSSAKPDVPETGRFVQKELQVEGVFHRYQVFVPTRDAGGRHPPVILFLHGSGERGDDNQRQTDVGLGAHIRQHMADFPAIAVFPQTAADQSWSGANARMALAELEASVREFNGDEDRITLTGMSRGGYGVYELALMEPKRFAALVPVCGGITSPGLNEPLQVEGVATAPDPFAAVAQRLQHLPMWIFHGGKDDVVTPDQSRHMVEAMRKIGGNVRYTEFAEAGHNAWDPAYATPELWTWLFAQER